MHPTGLALLLTVVVAGCLSPPTPDGGETRLLLVRETDRVDADGDGMIFADFGPHCAPVSYTLDPPRVELRTNAPAGPAVLVRDWRDGPHPQHVVTVSADRLDMRMNASRVVLGSPFDEDLPLVEVRFDGETFYANGTALVPGVAHEVRARHRLENEDGRFDVESTLSLVDVGMARVTYRAPGACM